MKTYVWLVCLLGVVGCAGVKEQNKTKPVATKECDPRSDVGGTDGYHQYKCSAEGKIVEDKEAEDSINKQEFHRQDLALALHTRVLSKEEMAEVLNYGPNLFVQLNQSFYQETVNKEFNEALEIQRQLRAMNDAPKAAAAVPFDVPPKFERGIRQESATFGEGYNTCEDRKRFLLMSEDGKWHCLALGAVSPK